MLEDPTIAEISFRRLAIIIQIQIQIVPQCCPFKFYTLFPKQTIDPIQM